MKDIYYENWEDCSGNSEEVEKLSFVGYVFDGGGIKMYKDSEGNKYICSFYKCKKEDGSTETLAFREPYESETIFAVERDVGWNFTRYEDASFEVDVIPDSITCSRKEIEDYENRGITLPRPARSENKELNIETTKDRQRRFVLQHLLKNDDMKMYHDVIRTRLIYLETPTIETSREFKESKELYPHLHRQLNDIVQALSRE